MTERMTATRLVSLDVKEGIWSQFYMVAPLVLIGTREGDRYDLAPKHLATPIGWGPYFGFVCTPRHSTYRNARETGCFTVSFPRPSQVLSTSIAAQPRCGEDREKRALEELDTFPASEIDGVFLSDAYLFLECKLERIVDGFHKNSLVIGYVRAAHVDEAFLRKRDGDDARMIEEHPLLAYLSPDRYAEIRQTEAFPFPAGFQR